MAGYPVDMKNQLNNKREKHLMSDNEFIEKLTPEEYESYNRLQTKIVILDNLFCIIFVLCITFLVWEMDKWSLMWFYLLPVFAFINV